MGHPPPPGHLQAARPNANTLHTRVSPLSLSQHGAGNLGSSWSPLKITEAPHFSSSSETLSTPIRCTGRTLGTNPARCPAPSHHPQAGGGQGGLHGP